MASSNHGDDAVSSRSPTEETTAAEILQLTNSTGTLTSLPFELIEEILCRLPVKLLLQLRCLCKSFASLISDTNFKKKHLHFSNHHHLIVHSTNDSGEVIFLDSPISSNLSNSRVTQTQLSFSLKKFGYNDHNTNFVVCSCDGILCIAPDDYNLNAILWNPTIMKFKILPSLKKIVPDDSLMLFYYLKYSFGYDPFIHNYNVIVVFTYHGNNGTKKEVSVHTLGTDHWRRIDDFPFCSPIVGSGIYVSGNVNWLTFGYNSIGYEVVSLNLEKESYKMISPSIMEKSSWELGVLRDCLCIFVSYSLLLNVWVMKEYGNKESWTKSYSLSYAVGSLLYPKALYIFEDDQMLVDFFDTYSNKTKLFVCDSKNGNFNIQNQDCRSINGVIKPNVYIESLISP